jgi:Amt family ammonium transporter
MASVPVFSKTPSLIRDICLNFSRNINHPIDPFENKDFTVDYFNNMDIAWILSASILVMLMTPAVGFLYGGLMKKYSILYIMGKCFAVFAVVSIIWALYGYSITFGPSIAGLFGDPTEYFLIRGLNSYDNKCNNEKKMKGIDATADYFPYPSSCNIPENLFFIFQAKFAGITPTLIIGAMSERMKMFNVLVFMSIWVTFVYCILTHWIWNENGWINKYFHVIDFAGGTVVHMASGFSSLAIALYLGKRKEVEIDPENNNIPMMVLGTMLLWFGWFGFNGGSSFQADLMAVNAIISTNLAAAAGLVSWMVCEYFSTKKSPTIIGISFGTICGLISITPSAGNILPIFSIIIGGVGSFLSFWVSNKWERIKEKVDDLDIFACHGISGMWGTFCTALFSSHKYNYYLYRRVDKTGEIIYDLDGIFYNFNMIRLLEQLFGIFVTAAYSFCVTYLILVLLKLCKMKIRTDLVNPDKTIIQPRLGIVEVEETEQRVLL